MNINTHGTPLLYLRVSNMSTGCGIQASVVLFISHGDFFQLFSEMPLIMERQNCLMHY